MKLQSSITNQAALTRVEAVIILAVVAAIVFVGIPKANSMAREKIEQDRMEKCLRNLRQIDGAVQTWTLENQKEDGQPVTFRDIQPYLHAEPVCPSAWPEDRTFEKCYSITTVEKRSRCLQKPKLHIIPGTEED